MFQNIFRWCIVFLWGAMIFSWIVMSIVFFSPNNADYSRTYIPKVQWKINFFQDKYGTQWYSMSWSQFWSSEQFYNQSFETVKVTFWNEPTQAPETITESVTRITRNSH